MYGTMPPVYYPTQPPPIVSSNPSPKGKQKKRTTEGSGLGAKWTIEEDRRLVESWINVSTNPITGVDHKKSGFWNKVAIAFNRYALEGATKRTGKICNAHWNRASPLVSKWCGSIVEAYRMNPSRTKEDTIKQLAHESYHNKVGKTFDPMHWWLLLKDVPK